MPNCTPQVAQELFVRTAAALVGDIGRSLVVDVPYMNIFPMATFDARVATVHQHFVQGRAITNDNQVFPTYAVLDSVIDACTPNTPNLVQTGGTTYNVQAGVTRSQSPRIPVLGNFSAYKGVFSRAVQSIKDRIKEEKAADIRGNCLLTLSGIKASVQVGVPIVNTTIGGYQQGTQAGNWPAEPTGTLDFNTLLAYARYQREVNLVKPYGEGASRHLKFIGSADQIELFRQQANLNYDLRVLSNMNQQVFAAAGGDKRGLEYINDYYFEGPYRELMFAIDQRPARSNWVGGVPVFQQPETVAAGSQGYTFIPNPTWLDATYEWGFLLGDGGFTIEIPEHFTGEGEIRFASMLFGGQLEWIYRPDNFDNVFGDFGYLIYQMARAYRPEYPWFTMPIATQRCFPLTASGCPGGSSVAVGGGY